MPSVQKEGCSSRFRRQAAFPGRLRTPPGGSRARRRRARPCARSAPWASRRRAHACTVSESMKIGLKYHVVCILIRSVLDPDTWRNTALYPSIPHSLCTPDHVSTPRAASAEIALSRSNSTLATSARVSRSPMARRYTTNAVAPSPATSSRRRARP